MPRKQVKRKRTAFSRFENDFKLKVPGSRFRSRRIMPVDFGIPRDTGFMQVVYQLRTLNDLVAVLIQELRNAKPRQKSQKARRRTQISEK
jgi:hypothetical protein